MASSAWMSTLQLHAGKNEHGQPLQCAAETPWDTSLRHGKLLAFLSLLQGAGSLTTPQMECYASSLLQEFPEQTAFNNSWTQCSYRFFPTYKTLWFYKAIVHGTHRNLYMELVPSTAERGLGNRKNRRSHLLKICRRTNSILTGTIDSVNLVDSLAGTKPAKHMAWV